MGFDEGCKWSLMWGLMRGVSGFDLGCKWGLMWGLSGVYVGCKVI